MEGQLARPYSITLQVADEPLVVATKLHVGHATLASTFSCRRHPCHLAKTMAWALTNDRMPCLGRSDR